MEVDKVADMAVDMEVDKVDSWDTWPLHRNRAIFCNKPFFTISIFFSFFFAILCSEISSYEPNSFHFHSMSSFIIISSMRFHQINSRRLYAYHPHHPATNNINLPHGVPINGQRLEFLIYLQLVSLIFIQDLFMLLLHSLDIQLIHR